MTQPSPVKLFKTAGWFGLGLTLKKASDYAFDYGLYPAVVLSLGYVQGGVVMTLLSVVMNIMIIKAYDWTRQDLLMIEALKNLIHGKSDTGRFPRVRSILKRSDVAAFFFISWIEDPIVVTLYLRKGSYQYNGMSRQDWKIFLLSTVVSNLFWIISLASIIEVVKAVFL